MTSPADPSPSNTHKKRRLQFTSQLPLTIPRFNDDGTETDEWARYQSNLRLKSKWDSICQKFSTAHLLPQDEIYLGDERKGEQMKVVKDRGTLRQLTQPVEFGIFHIKDDDLKHVRLVRGRPSAASRSRQDGHHEHTDHDHDHYADDSEDELGEWTHTVQFSRMVTAPVATPALGRSPNTLIRGSPPDAQLAEFLEAEARRRALISQDRPDSDNDDGDNDGEDSDDVFDFGDPNREAKPAGLRFVGDGSVAPSSDRSLSPSSSADEIDVISLSSGSDDDQGFRRWASPKRQNVEDLVLAPTPFETLPFDDIDGLSQCLDSLLYQAPVAATTAVAAMPASGTITPATSQKTNEQDDPSAIRPAPSPPPQNKIDASPPASPRKKKQTPKKQTPIRPSTSAASPHKVRSTLQPTSTPSKHRHKRPPAAGSSASKVVDSDDEGPGAFAGLGDCLGPGQCIKSFCMQCGSVSAVSRHRKLKKPRADEPETPSKGVSMDGWE